MRWLLLLVLLVPTNANAAIAFVNSWSGAGSADTVSINTSTGTQCAAGNVIVAVFACYSVAAAQITTPTGGSANAWSSIVKYKGATTNVGFGAFQKVAAAGDIGATFTLSDTGASGNTAIAGVMCLSGVDTTTPVDPTGVGTPTDQLSVVSATSISPTSSGDALLFIIGEQAGGTIADPTGFSLGYNAQTGGVNTHGSYKLGIASGATGTVSTSDTPIAASAVLIALQAAATGSIKQYVNPTIRLGRPHPLRTWRH